MSANKKDQFGPQVRFNWGFHDGASDKAKGRRALNAFSAPSAWDKAYHAGYTAGFANGPADSSEKAWSEHQADVAARKAAGKFGAIRYA